jgi:hypothetical protein
MWSEGPVQPVVGVRVVSHFLCAYCSANRTMLQQAHGVMVLRPQRKSIRYREGRNHMRQKRMS